jgi:hypothetical protein
MVADTPGKIPTRHIAKRSARAIGTRQIKHDKTVRNLPLAISPFEPIDVAIVDRGISARRVLTKGDAVSLSESRVALKIAGEIADEMLALTNILAFPIDDPGRKIDTTPLEHAVVIHCVVMIDGADKFDIAAVDAAAIASQNFVNLLAADKAVECLSPVRHTYSSRIFLGTFSHTRRIDRQTVRPTTSSTQA